MSRGMKTRVRSQSVITAAEADEGSRHGGGASPHDRDPERSALPAAGIDGDGHAEVLISVPTKGHAKRPTGFSPLQLPGPGRNPPRIRASLMWTCVVLCGFMLLTIKTLAGPEWMGSMGWVAARMAAATPLAGADPEAPQTLVIYTHSNSDSEYERNLRFFVRYGMWPGDGCEYLIIIQQGPDLVPTRSLPELPRNARYVYHENRCYDWGTFGWAIAEGKVDTARYRYLIFMNSSTRGPFLPPYWPESVHWSVVLTSRLTDRVKLVGATISCEPTWLGADMRNEMRQNPHVQSYVMATDQVGLQVMVEDGHIFNCYDDMADTIFYAELGASRAILEAGFTLDSLMLKYKGVDWTDKGNWNCSGSINPYRENAYDGVNLNPMEVLFIKVKGFVLQGDWSSPVMATVYDRWLATRGQPGAANYNQFLERQPSYRLAGALMMWARGPKCFDFDLYRAKSRDLPHSLSRDDLWLHFVHDGQFEGRPFRFTCPNLLKRPEVADKMIRSLPKFPPVDALVSPAAQPSADRSANE